MCLDKFDVSPCLAQVSVNKEKYRHPICTKNGQSPRQPAITRSNGGTVRWLDYRLGEGDECISADTDFACSLGMAFAVA